MSISSDPSTFYASDPVLGWGAEDISARFGNIALARIVLDPVPGTANEVDLIRIHDQSNRICELVDGTLVEKAMGRFESYLMFVLSGYFHDYLKTNPLGYVVGESGWTRFLKRQIRASDLSYFSWKSSPDNAVGDEAIGTVIPELVVEILSRGNTKQEMDGKLREYLQAGVKIVWYIDHRKKEVAVYVGPEMPTLLTENDVLIAGDVLPDFRIVLKEFFAAGQGPQTL